MAFSLAFERRPPGDHFIQDHAEAENVGAFVDAFTLRLLRRHVTACAHDRAGMSARNRYRHCFRVRINGIAVGEFGDAEVQYLHEAIANELVLPQHYVFGLDVAMHDAGGVCCLERHCYLNADAERFIEFHWTTQNTVTQRFAFDVFGRDVVAAFGLADFINSENVWMVERENRAGFLFETSQSTLGAREFLRQYFQRDLAAVLLRVLTEKDLAHATLAQPAQDAIMGDVLWE